MQITVKDAKGYSKAKYYLQMLTDKTGRVSDIGHARCGIQSQVFLKMAALQTPSSVTIS